MKARDVMTPNPTTRRPEDDLESVLEVMRKEDVGIVPITEGNGDQKAAGVVTDRDIALYLGEKDRRPSEVRASEVMKTDIVSVGPDADIHEVSRKMQEAQVRRVLVTEGKRLIGVIATADLARASAQSNRDKIGEEVEKVMEKVSEETGSHRART
ncbi:MAG TPA: CBS domain-containing protein [Thermoanaerobaculia bacterium]|jgi:CBS domain-containing protein|nr:CBS domain-containing protein [Thermoanaerobaculia bacterium]